GSGGTEATAAPLWFRLPPMRRLLGWGRLGGRCRSLLFHVYGPDPYHPPSPTACISSVGPASSPRLARVRRVASRAHSSFLRHPTFAMPRLLPARSTREVRTAKGAPVEAPEPSIKIPSERDGERTPHESVRGKGVSGNVSLGD